MNIFLHIGHHKTGTSHFQRTCDIFRGQLIENGIYCPHGGERRSHQHGPLFRTLVTQPNEAAWSKLEAWVATLCNTLILSAESLVWAEPGKGADLVRRLQRWGRVHIIYTIRNWTDYLPSRFAQETKRGDSWTWSEFLESCYEGYETNKNLNFGLTLSEYAQADPDEFHLIEYKRGFNQDHIFRLTGVEQALAGHQAYMDARGRDQNPRQSPIHSQVQRICNLVENTNQGRPTNLFFDMWRSPDLKIGHNSRVRKYRVVAANRLLNDLAFMGELEAYVERSDRMVETGHRPDFLEWAATLDEVCRQFGLPKLSQSWFTSPPPNFWHGEGLKISDLSDTIQTRIRVELLHAEKRDKTYS